jgi:hypothetical protein
VFLGEFGTFNDKTKSTKIEIICSRFFFKNKTIARTQKPCTPVGLNPEPLILKSQTKAVALSYIFRKCPLSTVYYLLL